MKYSKLVLGLVVLLSAAVLVGCGEQKATPAPVAEDWVRGQSLAL